MVQERVRFIKDTGLYEDGQMILERYGEKYKLTYFKKLLRKKGIERAIEKVPVSAMEQKWDEYLDLMAWIRATEHEPPPTMEEFLAAWSAPNYATERKLAHNVRRAKNTVYELAMCNKWDYFATFTIDGERYDRSDLKGFYKKLSKWINNYNYRNGCKIRYLLIPELHKDKKNWHMHGLLAGIPSDRLTPFVRGIHPRKLVDGGYKNWNDYYTKFGFCSLDDIKSHEKVSSYITKYITKDVGMCVSEVGGHMYYCSTGLKRRERIVRQFVEFNESDFCAFDYQNEYVAVKWMDEGSLNIFREQYRKGVLRESVQSEGKAGGAVQELSDGKIQADILHRTGNGFADIGYIAPAPFGYSQGRFERNSGKDAQAAGMQNAVMAFGANLKISEAEQYRTG